MSDVLKFNNWYIAYLEGRQNRIGLTFTEFQTLEKLKKQNETILKIKK